MSDERAHHKLLKDAAYMVNNPSAWDSYDEVASEMIRVLVEHAGVLGTEKHADAEAIGAALGRATAAEAALAAAMAGAVRVKPMDENDRASISEAAYAAEREYRRRPGANGQVITEWDGIDSWLIAETERRILAALEPDPAAKTTANCCICGRIVDTREESECGDPFGCQRDNGEWVCSSECSEKADPTPDWMREGIAAQDREALVAATLERAAEKADAAMKKYAEAAYSKDNADGRAQNAAKCYCAGEIGDTIRALATPAQTDALAAVRREARAEGMRIAAGIAFDRRGTQSGDTWDAGWYQACATVRHEILDAAEKEASHD